MSPITAPINRDSAHDVVANLQDALLALIRDTVPQLSDNDRSAMEARIRTERGQSAYGDATAKFVGMLQEQSHLPVTSVVDEQTAAALNVLLRQRGLFDPPGTSRTFLVSGQVLRADGSPLADVEVRASHEGQSSIRLGQDTADAEGRYTIRYDVLPEIANVSLLVTVLGSDGSTLRASDILRSAPSIAVVNLIVPLTMQPVTQQRLEGRVILEHGVPAERVTLRLYRRDFGGTETRLAETTTREAGVYSMPYDLTGKSGGIEVRAVAADGSELTLSRTLHDFGGTGTALLNLAAPATLQPLATEFQRLTQDMAPHVGEIKQLANARENDERQDLTLLNRATGWDARLIALASSAATLSADTTVGLPHEVLYGLFRSGLPSDKLQLARVSMDAVGLALKKAKESGIVNLADAQVEAAKTQFATFARETCLSVRAPGSASTYAQVLDTAGLDGDTRNKFASLYLAHRGDGPELWKKAADAGVTAPQIQTLQRQGKLAFLTSNSAPMTARLQQTLAAAGPSALADQGFHDPEKWKTEARALANNDPQQLAALIPTTYGGANVEDRLAAYAQDMARKVRVSYPTQVVRNLVENDAADTFKLGTARQATTMLLKNASARGFRLGQTPVEAFIANNPEVLAGIDAGAVQGARQGAKTLQRVYQLTPSNEVMPVLLSLGLDSAFDIVAVSQHVFLDQFGHHFPSLDEARLIYRKAQQVASVTYNLFTIARKFDTEAAVQVMSSPVEVRNAARNDLIKQFPTMESLFGSVDYCECEHCRSVLSPAAYLVDLLQFIDVEAPLWDNFLTLWKTRHNGEDYTAKYQKPYDALIERRPDLIHIPLTCENTNTALPYIDLVNEILEYYVANGKLDAVATGDTGGAATEDLLAEPQNVIAEAYEKLQQVRYPLQLPFDLWLETVRRFCEYFDTPLWKLLETFRTDDSLLAPTQAYDRATAFIESLGISPSERAMFCDPDPLAHWFELFGFVTAAEATTAAVDTASGERIDLNSAKALARRLGITYMELVAIVQTGFVNPNLAPLVVLYKLKLSIEDLAFYADQRVFFDQNKNLLGADRGALSSANQVRFDALTKNQWDTLAECAALEKRLDDLSFQYGSSGFDARAWLNTSLAANAFDNVLVLADPNAGGDFELATLRYRLRDAGPADFLRINLFVRLWRKLGWSIEETDRALQVFVPRSTPFVDANFDRAPLLSALIGVAHVHALEDMLQVGQRGRLKLLTLWSDIATTGKSPLYRQIFLSPTALKSDGVFDDPLGRYLDPESLAAQAQLRQHEVQLENVAPADKLEPAAFAAQPKIAVTYDAIDQVQHLSYQGALSDADKGTIGALSPSPALPPLLAAVQEKARNFPRIIGHSLAIQGALALTAAEMDEILADAGLAVATADLSIANLSLLYRYRLLSKWLKVSVHDLVSLKQLSGVDPFHALHPDPLVTLDQDQPFTQTLRFVEIAALLRDSGFKLEDLDYLMRHRFDDTGKYHQDEQATRSFLATLANGIRAIRTEHAVPEDAGAITAEVLQQKLGLGLAPSVVERFLAMMNGTAEFTATQGGVPPANRFASADFAGSVITQVAYEETRQEQSLTVRGVVFDAQSSQLKVDLPHALPPAPHVPSALFSGLLDDVQAQARAFFDNNLRKQKLRLEAQAGFLEDADFATLFAPLKPLLEILPSDTEAQIADKLKTNEAITQDNESTLLGRRFRIAQTFLPLLQQQLVRQLIIQTLTAQTGADPQLLQSLLGDERLLAVTVAAGNPQPLSSVFAATGDYGLTASFFASPDTSGAELAAAPFADADTSLRDRARAPLKPGGTNSARFDAYLQVPAPGAYRFFVTLDKAGATAELRFEHLPNPVLLTGAAPTDGAEISAFLELQPGVSYRFTLELRNLAGGDARLRVQGETLPKGSLTQLKLYPLASLEGGARALLLLNKALHLTSALALTERETRYLLTHAADFDNLSLSRLPTQLVEDTATVQALFKPFVRLARYTRLRRDMAGGTDAIIDVFEAPNLAKTYTAIAALTRRDESAVMFAVNVLFTVPALSNELPLIRLWDVLQAVDQFGITVASLQACTRVLSPAATSARRAGIARDLKDTLKARFDAETWRHVAQPIFDDLRRRQRDALAAYVMQQHAFVSIEQLYEYFLIDPGMEPVVQTSRIRLATASVQLFVQRCMLNLEKRVHPSVINGAQWDWMKRYRVWEANRKIFLFPENWLEPEFRDDKTPLFRELEGNLLQGDVSSDLVEDAFLTYLRKLDQIARLDIVAMHLEDQADPALNVLHVIGRTSNQNKFFYRRYAHQVWTAWEPISAEITGEHLAPVMWRDRLYLFWVTFVDRVEQQDPPPPPASSSGLSSGASDEVITVGLSLLAHDDPALTEMTLSQLTQTVKSSVGQKQVQVQLHWSEYLQGEWSTHESSDFNDSIVVSVPFSFNRRNVFIHVSKSYDAGEERGVFVHLGGAIGKSFYLAGRNSSPEIAAYSAPPRNPYGAGIVRATRYFGNGPLTVAYTQRITTEDGKQTVDPPVTPSILQQSSPYWMLECNNDITLGSAEFASLVKPVFYHNNLHTLFVQPYLTERTIEEWQEWVTPMPQPDPNWDTPDWWKEVFVQSVVPSRKPPVLVEPDNPMWTLPVGEGSLRGLNPKVDWMVNPSTGLVFDGSLIGPGGRAEIGALSAAASVNSLASGAGTLQVQAGSGVTADAGLFAAGADALNRSGLQVARGGLNVIAGSGFNSALAQNFATHNTRPVASLVSRAGVIP